MISAFPNGIKIYILNIRFRSKFPEGYFDQYLMKAGRQNGQNVGFKKLLVEITSRNTSQELELGSFSPLTNKLLAT